MRRSLFQVLGVLESLVALVLLAFAWQLPGPAEVHDRVGRVERVSRQTGRQVEQLRQRLEALRERRPQMQALALRLQAQMRLVNDNLTSQQIDYATVRTVSDALGDVARGLDGLSDTLDPQGIGQLGAGLKATADYLDRQVAPAAAKAAGQLDQTAADVRGDALRLSALLRQAPPDLKAAREIHDGLARFSDGLERMDRILKLQQLGAMREGFKGLESSLTTGAEQVERLAGYTYPVVSFDGLRPVVDQKQFWPEGDRIAEGMRKAAKGVAAAAKEADGLAADLPKLREALGQSRRVAAATREALGTALKQQEKIEPLLKDAPQHAARLAEQLPQLSADLGKILRDTARLKDVAALLRQAQKGMDAAAARWPELRQNLGRSTVLLRATRAQLESALAHREEYEAALRQTHLLSKTFTAALPLLTEELEEELHQQEQSLADLGTSIDEVSAVLPACGQGASRILQMTRLLLGLVAAIFALHGGHLVLSSRLGPKYP
jgi:chromosome segregation ATPase